LTSSTVVVAGTVDVLVDVLVDVDVLVELVDSEFISCELFPEFVNGLGACEFDAKGFTGGELVADELLAGEFTVPGKFTAEAFTGGEFAASVNGLAAGEFSTGAFAPGAFSAGAFAPGAFATGEFSAALPVDSFTLSNSILLLGVEDIPIY
jgi:hypothetical protein